jgi:hypothetical protein
MTMRVSGYSVPSVGRQGGEAAVVDVERELVVTLPISDHADVDNVRCRDGVLEVLCGDDVVMATALPDHLDDPSPPWIRRDDSLTAVVRRVH